LVRAREAAMWWYHDGYGMGPWGWVLMTVFTLAFWGLIVWAVVTLVRRLPPAGGPRESSARDILDERFARGEIDEEEYRRRLAALEGRTGSRSST